jgi:hypothetical protein
LIKREMQERDFVVSGIHIGEHSFEPENVISEIKERCIDNGLNFVTIRTRDVPVPKHYFVEWAKYLTENKIYFTFLYTTQNAPKGMKSQFDKATVAEMKSIAGEYFIGDILGELGSSLACKWKGYSAKLPMPQNVKSLSEAKQNYIDGIKHYVDIDKELGIDNILTVEATALSKYNLEAGTTIPLLELMCGNPEILVSALRGTARAYGSELWGTYIAHEWYGGMRHDDILKQKRLLLAYRYAYLSGTNIVCLESGDESLESYGYKYPIQHDYCRQYQEAVRDFAKLTKEDARPKGGPKVKIAFVQGNLDAWGSWGGSSLWNQFGREEWGHNTPEYTWRILEELGTKRNWYDIANFGVNDLSATPANGMYDVIPAESSFEAMSQYDYLIFTGWNTMREDIYNNLEKYVSNGGTLFMLASHLNTEDKRDERIKLINDGDVEKLFGCRLDVDGIRTNAGVKFQRDSLKDNLMYPGTLNYVCDPVYSHGYASYAKVELKGGTAAARLSESFIESEEFSELPIAMVENRLGKGTAILLTSLEHAGSGAIYPLYRAMVRELVTASHRENPIKVYGSERVRYAVYDGDVIYLLNTDYDADANVIIEKHGEVTKVTLKPCELKRI